MPVHGARKRAAIFGWMPLTTLPSRPSCRMLARAVPVGTATVVKLAGKHHMMQ
jgi:hypothetical protein